MHSPFSAHQSNVFLNKLTQNRIQNLDEFLAYLSPIAPLLDALSTVVFFIKDDQARYLLANKTLAIRLGLSHLDAIIGKTAEEIFGDELGKEYTQQDKKVLKEHTTFLDQLELHIYPKRVLGWCLTYKYPLFDLEGQCIAMAGVSIDIQSQQVEPHLNTKLALVTKYIRDHLDQVIRMETLAGLANLSSTQLERQFKKIFQTTPQQYVQKMRIERAIELLKEDLPITEIALHCGYFDHSAFSRQFKQVTGLTPTQFKQKILGLNYKT